MLFDINGLNFVQEEDNSCFSFIFDNLPQNMGVTLGNYLRRFLLDYTSGISLVGIKLKDGDILVKSKFSLISGIRESVPYLIQNFKRIILDYSIENNGEDKLFNDGKVFRLPLQLINESDKEMVIFAKDISFDEVADSGINLKNPDLYITTLSSKKKIDIITYWKEWWGYHQSDEQKKDYFYEDSNNEIIVLDTDFSPIKLLSISFNVEKVITGIDSEKERMILKISKGEYPIDVKRIFFKAILESQKIFSDILSKLK